MTTIAYRAGVMASDSRYSDDDDAVVTRGPKIDRLDSGALLGSAGDDDCRDLVKMLATVKTARGLPSRADLAALKLDYKGLLVLPKGQLFQIQIDHMKDRGEWTAFVTEIHEPYAAVGAGYQFALGAMGHGATAAEAVAIACRFDLKSGPPVRVVHLKPKVK